MLIKYADLWHPRKGRRRDSVSFLYWLLALQHFYDAESASVWFLHTGVALKSSEFVQVR